MEFSNYLVSWVVTYLGDLQPTYIGVMIYLLSSMDILVFPFQTSGENFPAIWPLTEVQKNLAKNYCWMWICFPKFPLRLHLLFVCWSGNPVEFLVVDG